jgi:5'-3' exonuclease
MGGAGPTLKSVPAPLLIADVPWLLYRSFFALPKSIVGTEGRPVNALLGTVNALLTVIHARLPARRPRGVAVCMGAEEASYRVELYPAYHAHRDPMPAELSWQWERAPALLASLGWTVAGSDDLEADDVMFSLARVEEQSGGRARMVTGDRDLFGAVSDRVAVVELRKGGETAEIGPAEVRERYGVGPALVADVIALRGDPSDGLPGARGIGAKTAAALLLRYGSLEAVLAAAGAPADAAGEQRGDGPGADTEMRPRTAAALRESAALLRTFKRVATLQQIDLERPPDGPTDYTAGARVSRELGMNGLADRLEQFAAGAES